ncbi:glycosyltransferase [Glycomyces luteolus]|uniref:Glycosyltransferase n=1 Tax=Glycomyces luteolus TaxID=2670330 RepID=A0A9X3PCN7_9ACTN|nr:glycosyltransferase [Glycomyces luteolus]MDA1361088.1 glycosyltransferase [Glycomyces luteolus]
MTDAETRIKSSSEASPEAIADRLVERALHEMHTRSADHIHQWGQYHNSRLARLVLARLACPQDPDAVLRPGVNRTRLRRADLNLEAVCALAATIGLKAADPDERATALELFDLAQRRLGPRFPIEYRELHVMTAYLLGRAGRVRALAKAYDEIPGRLVEAIHCQEAHPRGGGSAREYVRRFRTFADMPELSDPVDGEPLGVDRLRTRPVRAIEGGPLISVVMTCFEPDETLLTAVRSIVAQSWQHWELLLVDDGSGPRYRDVLGEAAVDPRVKLIIQPENAGTYQARNRALAVAKGEFITGLDSDDWAHPRRLEMQVQPLIDHPHLVMVESRSIAVKGDLSMVIDPQIGLIAARSTPIMVRAEPVLRRIGFYDEVRRSADSEYRWRIKTVFGKGKVLHLLSSGPLTLVRYSGSTLSAGEVSRHWMSATRTAYHSGFSHWHRRIARGVADPFLGSLARPRPFPIARDITRGKTAGDTVAYARIYAADWRSLDRRRRLMLDDAARLAEAGFPVALLHCPEWIRVDRRRPLIDWAVLNSAETHGFDFIDLETRHTAPIVVPTEAYAELLRFEHPELAADRVRVQPSSPQPFAEAPPGKIDHDRVPRPPSLVWTRMDALLAGAGGCLAAAAVTLAAAVQPASLEWAVAGSLAVWVGLVLTLTARHAALRRTYSTESDQETPVERGGKSPLLILKQGLGVVSRRPLWAVAAVAPALPALAAALPSSHPVLPAAATAGALGALAALAQRYLSRSLDSARAAAVEPDHRPPPRRPSSADPPSRRLREIERWDSRLKHGWSSKAGDDLRRIAESKDEHIECRVKAMAALCGYGAKRFRALRDGRTLEVDIVIVSTLNLVGGTTSANEAEILAYRSAGLKVALVDHPVLDRAMHRPVNPRLRALIDGEHVIEVRPQDTVRCDLAIVRFPVALEHLMEDRPRIDAARTVLLVNQTPFEEYGFNGGCGKAWSIPDVHRNVTAWLGPHTWYAIGPAVRDILRAHHAEELVGVDLADDFWYETIDIADWAGMPRREREEEEPIRIGRHSRDDVAKFPNMAKRLRSAYPDAADIEVHVLGGHGALRRILGTIPPRWTVHRFGALPAADFLADIDVYVYFYDERLAEAFGRAPLEAMAAGVPCILQPSFAELFGDGALYCEPEEVETVVRRLMEDPAYYAERSAAGPRTVRERFSPDALLCRVSALGVAPGSRPTVVAEPAAPTMGGAR